MFVIYLALQLFKLIPALGIQILGNFGVAKDALTEIASRLRARTLRDANVGAEPAPVGPVQLVGVAGGLPSRGPLPSGPVGAGISGGYEPFRVFLKLLTSLLFSNDCFLPLFYDQLNHETIYLVFVIIVSYFRL